jgi:hypothetical protein
VGSRLWLRREVPPLLDEPLALLVAWMGRAGDDDLNGPFCGREQAQQPSRIVQQQVRPFVGGESAGEAERQHVRIEHLLDQPRRIVDRAASC